MTGKRVGIGISLAALAMVAAAHSGDSIRKAFAAKVQEAGKSSQMAIAGKDGWDFFVPELRYLSVGPFWGENAAKVSRASSPTAADPLPAILDFKAQLDKKGIDLLVVPVPAKAAIYPDKLLGGSAPSAGDRVDATQAEFLRVLGQKGVKTLDLTPAYLKFRAEHPDQTLYSKQDTHWSGAGLKVAADAIAASIKARPWYAGVPKGKFIETPLTVHANGDLVSMLGGKPLAETFSLTSVKQMKGGAASAIESNRQSPVILLGDSHNLVYSVGGDLIAKGAGLPENLSKLIGFVPDTVAVMGSGATPARVNLLRRGDNLAGKKMIVWVFTAREFTEGQGWKLVPVIRP